MWRISPSLPRPETPLKLAGILLGATLAGQAAAALPVETSRALAEAGIPESHVALVIQDVGSAEPLWRHGAQRSLNPASVMKLLTTLAALDTLDPARTWQTRAWVDGDISDGVLRGDLVLQGGGDPSLTLERFWLLLRDIRARGIREIRGNVLLDSSLYDLEPADPGAFDNAPLQPYNAPPAALLVNHNAVRLLLAPVNGAVQARLDPPVFPIAGNQAQIDAQAACVDWDDLLVVTPEADGLHLAGRYPAVCGERALWLNLFAPDDNTAALFRALWMELGGTLSGQILSGTVGEHAYLLASQDSPSLGRIVRDVNEYSNNVMAKMLFLNLGIARHGGRGNWAKSERAMQAWLRESGLDMPELVIDNGAGLSRIARISADSLARLLQFAARRPAYPDFAASMPALGRTGTLRKRMQDSDLAGRARLKTGSLNRVRSLAGYVMDSCGRQRILVWLVNHPRASAARAAQESVIQAAAGNDSCTPGTATRSISSNTYAQSGGAQQVRASPLRTTLKQSRNALVSD